MNIIDYLYIDVADSDVAQSRRLKDSSARSNSETRSYYTNDDSNKREKIHSYFNHFSNYNTFFIDINKTKQYIDLFEKNVLPHENAFINDLSGFRLAIANFRTYLNISKLRIPEMMLTGDDKRYLKFDNNNLDLKKFRDLICGRITKIVVSKETDNKFVLWLELDPNYRAYFETKGSTLSKNQIEKPERIKGGINRIYYGTPGSGKSFLVKKIFEEQIDNITFRTTFYPDYSNSDFVGQILPRVNINDEVFYEFTPGPFSLSLKCAYENPNKRVVLIIEEINRGNASAIFGEIFQLLDRDSSGNSIYNVSIVMLNDWLKINGIEIDSIIIPSNMTIIATMNTSDQNIFTLDTAFKRRWEFELVSNDFSKKDYSKWFDWFIPGSNYTWKEFVSIVNDHILINNKVTMNNEDKRLGVYFISEKELCQQSNDSNSDKKYEFANKVLMYIWEDVAKIDRDNWFVENIQSFENLVDEFIISSLEVFFVLFPNK